MKLLPKTQSLSERLNFDTIHQSIFLYLDKF